MTKDGSGGFGQFALVGAALTAIIYFLGFSSLGIATLFAQIPVIIWIIIFLIFIIWLFKRWFKWKIKKIKTKRRKSDYDGKVPR